MVHIFVEDETIGTRGAASFLMGSLGSNPMLWTDRWVNYLQRSRTYTSGSHLFTTVSICNGVWETDVEFVDNPGHQQRPYREPLFHTIYGSLRSKETLNSIVIQSQNNRAWIIPTLEFEEALSEVFSGVILEHIELANSRYTNSTKKYFYQLLIQCKFRELMRNYPSVVRKVEPDGTVRYDPVP